VLKRHSQLILALLIVADAAAVAVGWLLSYWLRFKYLPVSPVKGVPGLTDKFLPMLGPVVLAHLIVFARVQPVSPARQRSPLRDNARHHHGLLRRGSMIVIVIDYVMPQRPTKFRRGFVATCSRSWNGLLRTPFPRNAAH
jgi:hypothetical protein